MVGSLKQHPQKRDRDSSLPLKQAQFVQSEPRTSVRADSWARLPPTRYDWIEIVIVDATLKCNKPPSIKRGITVAASPLDKGGLRGVDTRYLSAMRSNRMISKSTESARAPHAIKGDEHHRPRPPTHSLPRPLRSRMGPRSRM